MTKFLTVLATGSALALVSIAAPTTADARCRGCGIAAGVVGGIAAGAAIAAATSPRYGYYDSGYYAYEPGYAYYGGPYYGAYDSYDYGYSYGYRPYRYGGYGYRPYRYGGATSDYTNRDRMLQGTR